MSEDQWVRETPLTPQELAAYRAEQVAFQEEHFGPTQKYTCDECGLAPKCKLAFDGYNTDGDCLYEK